MKNSTPGLLPKALTPLALALLVLGSAVIHAAQLVVDDAGLTSVFNGHNLKGWTLQAHAVWQVENGDFVGRQDPLEKEDGWLFSEAEWSDFTLELEFKVPERSNSGIALRMPREATGSPDVHGYEVQISDLPARKLTGSLLHHIESKTNNLHQANAWNRLAVTCEDDHIVVYLNGLKVVDAKEKGSKRGRIGMQVPKGAEFARQEVRFRNIRVKELKPKQALAEMLVNGNFAAGMTNWVVMESGATGKAEIVAEGPDGKPALRLKVLTVGDKPWRLQVYQAGMRVEKGKAYVLTFWAKSDRAGSIMVNCMQNHAPWDHQTQKQMPVSTDWQPLRYTFVAPWDDHKVRISFTDLGTIADQVYWFANCSLVPKLDTKTAAAPAPTTAARMTTPSAEFVWKGDCSSEAAFVGSNHPTIPGHYEYLPDPKEPARGLVFAGHLTPEFTTADPEKFHLHPDIYFDRFVPGSVTVSFDVKVDDLAPSELGPCGNNAWLNLVTLFDETTVAGGKSFHPSAMVNLVGASGTNRLQAYSIHAAGAGAFYEKLESGPVVPTGKWITVRMEVDVKTKQVRVYQGKALASTGPYKGKPGLVGAHMGLYAHRKVTRATVFNDDITINVG